MSRLVLGAVVIAAAFLAVLSLAPWEMEPDTPGLPPELAEEPDLYMRDATISQHLESGTLKYRLKSQEIKHFAETGSVASSRLEGLTRLTEPDLTLYTEADDPWRVSARKGTIDQQPGPAGEMERRPAHSGPRREVDVRRRDESHEPDGST